MAISLVTDSTADVPAELCDRYGIRVVPAIIVVGQQTYRDGVDLTRAEFYQRLPAMNPAPTTAAPAAGEFEAVYESLPEGPALSLHLAASLSGIFNAARLGAERFGDRVRVMDCGSVSFGVGWQVIAAAEAIAAGAALENVLEVIRSIRSRVRAFVLLDTLENLRRGGRISLLRASIASALQIKPLIELAEGALTQVAVSRTRQKAMASLLSQMQSLGDFERLAVLYTDNPDPAIEVRDRLADRSRTPPLLIQATPALGAHVGANAVGVIPVVSDQPAARPDGNADRIPS